MAYTIVDSIVGTQVINETSTTQRVPLGLVVQASDTLFGTGAFIYLKAPTSAANKGAWVTYNADDWSTTLLAADAIGPVAINMNLTASGDYGWFQITGKAVGKVAAGFLDNANVYATATAGVKNAKGASAVATTTTHDGTTLSSSAEFEIHRPFMDDGLAA